MNKVYIPNSGLQLVNKLQADLAATNAQLTSNLTSLLKPKAPAATPRVKAQMESATPLPKHELGAFRDRLHAPLRIIEA